MSKVQTDQPSQAMLNKKNPKRVEAGKRLAAISKQAKEAKRLEREAQQDANNTNQSEGMGVDKLYFIGGLVAVGAVCYLCINKDKLISDKKSSPTTPKEEEPPPKRKSKRILDE